MDTRLQVKVKHSSRKPNHKIVALSFSGFKRRVNWGNLENIRCYFENYFVSSYHELECYLAVYEPCYEEFIVLFDFYNWTADFYVLIS